MCTMISTITCLFQLFSPKQESEFVSSFAKLKITTQKETKESKAERIKKEFEVVEEPCWKPWDMIWPKENSKLNSLPTYNSTGKYVVKLFWMV